VDRVILVVPEGREEYVRAEIVRRYDIQKVSAILPGGENRQESVYHGFMALEDDVSVVLIHDAVRPLVRVKTIEDVTAAAIKHNAAIAAIPVKKIIANPGSLLVMPGKKDMGLLAPSCICRNYGLTKTMKS
jgi:2-C-methyl-D-erythritol 4-phosphate cytidylyltransferase